MDIWNLEIRNAFYSLPSLLGNLPASHIPTHVLQRRGWEALAGRPVWVHPYEIQWVHNARVSRFWTQVCQLYIKEGKEKRMEKKGKSESEDVWVQHFVRVSAADLYDDHALPATAAQSLLCKAARKRKEVRRNIHVSFGSGLLLFFTVLVNILLALAVTWSTYWIYIKRVLKKHLFFRTHNSSIYWTW